MNSPLKIFHLIAIFALAALPFVATLIFFYPDERHYTDGALIMLHDRGWLVQKAADGTPWFKKPPLACWTVAASWAAFGVNILAARLPFLLAGCGTLWLTHRLARKLTNDPPTALLAAIVLAANPQFFFCSIRAMPDALLVFSITLSAGGFLRLIVCGEFTAAAFWMAYGGATLAALSKGMLGAMIVLFAWAFMFWRERRLRAVTKLFHLPSCVTAGILTMAWLVFITRQHGVLRLHSATGLALFFNDQVTGNLRGHWWSPGWRVPAYALILFFNFLPWSATATEFLARRKFLTAGAMPPAAQKFILGWTAFLMLVFSLGENVSLRYLLPATPLVAILVANWLQGAETVRLIFSVRRILKITIAGLLLADALFLFIETEWPWPLIVPVLLAGLFLAAIIALGAGALRHGKFSAAQALGLAILLFWLMFAAAALPVVLPERAQQIAVTLRANQSDPAKPVLLVGNVQLAGRVRICLGQNWTVVQSDRLDFAAAKNFARVLVPENEVHQFAGRGWQIQTAAVSPELPPRREWWLAIKSRQLPEILLRHAQKMYLATHD